MCTNLQDIPTYMFLLLYRLLNYDNRDPTSVNIELYTVWMFRCWLSELTWISALSSHPPPIAVSLGFLCSLLSRVTQSVFGCFSDWPLVNFLVLNLISSPLCYFGYLGLLIPHPTFPSINPFPHHFGLSTFSIFLSSM